MQEPHFESSCKLEAFNFTVLKRFQLRFSCGFCKTFKNFYFTEYWQTTTSESPHVWSACCIYGLFDRFICCIDHFNLLLFLSKTIIQIENSHLLLRMETTETPEIFSNMNQYYSFIIFLLHQKRRGSIMGRQFQCNQQPIVCYRVEVVGGILSKHWKIIKDAVI